MKRINMFPLIFIMLLLFYGTSNHFIFTHNVEAKENELIYESLSVFVMPQYTTPEDWDSDKPAVFVSLLGSLVNESDTPYSGEIRIPTNPSNSDVHFSLVGKFNEEGVAQEVEATLDEQTNEIVWQVDKEVNKGEHYNFVVEYYFEIDHDKSNFAFTFPYEVERKAKIMDILFFEPYNAEDFRVKGNIGEGEEVNAFGMKAQKFDLGEVEENTPYDISVSYIKEDMVTTLEAIEDLKDQADKLAELSKEKSEEENSVEQATNHVEVVITSSIGVVVLLLFVFFIVLDVRKNRKKKERIVTEENQ